MTNYWIKIIIPKVSLTSINYAYPAQDQAYGVKTFSSARDRSLIRDFKDGKGKYSETFSLPYCNTEASELY
jgi:hypothetical protein